RDELPQHCDVCVEVDVAVRRELRVGDVLQDDRGQRYTVAEVVPVQDMPHLDGQPADVLLHPDAGAECAGRTSLTRIIVLLEEKLQARWPGDYDPVPELPVAGTPGVPVEPAVTADIATALLRAGYATNLMELLTTKADDVDGRESYRQALVEEGRITATSPLGAQRLQNVLKAAGVVLELPLRQVAPGAETPDSRPEVLPLSVHVASPKEVSHWSFGEIKSPDTMNTRTLRPEKNGLLCERIFGPETDWECACGKYRGMDYQGMICDRCGVKVTHSRVRFRRMGHINLARPVVHPWFVGDSPLLADLLHMDRDDLNRVVDYQMYAVTNPGQSTRRRGELLHPDEAAAACTAAGPLEADVGAEAVRKLLQEARPELAGV